MREILTYGGYFEAFIETLTEDVVRKIDYVLSILSSQQMIPSKFVKHIEDGIFELRVEIAKRIKKEYYESQERRTDKEL